MSKVFIILFCALVGSAHGAEIQLFKQYDYGMVYADFLSDSTYYDCSEDSGETLLCKDGISFLSNDFTAVLTFQEKQLWSVSLVSEFSNLLYQQAFVALVKKFQLAVLLSNSVQLDLIELKKTLANEAELTAKINAFESVALNQGQLTYAFIDLNNTDHNHAKNIVELIHLLPDDAREIDLVVTSDEYQAWLTLKFSLPAQLIRKSEQLIQQKTEDF